MKYFVTIGSKEYGISVKKAKTVVVDGEEFVVDFWRDPDSPFVISS
jgi:hypothetical protein